MKKTLGQTIDDAIALYESKELKQCLALLTPLLSSPEMKLVIAYNNRAAICPTPLTAYRWILLAIEGLQKELGGDNIALIPVSVALFTALEFY